MKANPGLVNNSGFLFIVFSLFFSLNALNAQWNQTGPDGCYIRTLTVSGTNLFAGTVSDGVFVPTIMVSAGFQQVQELQIFVF